MRPEATYAVTSELVANVLSLAVAEGDEVDAGAEVALFESMKMEIPVLAEHPGTVVEVKVRPGDVVQDGEILCVIRRSRA